MQLIKSFFILIVLLVTTISFSYAQINEVDNTLAVNESVAQKPVIFKTIEVKVKGVGCSRDTKAINFNVAKVNGVSICETLKKGATTIFSVTYNPSVATEKDIYAAVENTEGCSNQTARPYKVKL